MARASDHFTLMTFRCETQQLNTVPEGTRVLHVIRRYLDYNSYPDYFDIPRSVTTLTIIDEVHSYEGSPIPPWIRDLTMINVPDYRGPPFLPRELEQLYLFECGLTSLEGIPPSLKALTIESCGQLSHVDPLPPVMDSIEIESMERLGKLDFLPSERVGLITLTKVRFPYSGIVYFPKEVGVLELIRCTNIKSLIGVNDVTGHILIRMCRLSYLEPLLGNVESLHIEEGSRRFLHPIPEKIKSLSMRCYFPFSILPAGLEHLKLSGTRHDNLDGLPENLFSLELRDLPGVGSFDGIPPFLKHLVLHNASTGQGFPWLRHLISADIDRLVTTDLGPEWPATEYTDGELYMSDARSRIKRAYQ